MTSLVTSDPTPVYLYASKVGVYPECVTFMNDALKAEEVPASRIITLPDSSYLKKALPKDSNLKNRASLIMPGCNTYEVAGDLKSLVSSIRLAIAGGWDYLGSCGGANLACSTMIQKHHKYGVIDISNFLKLSFLNLVAVDAHIPVYEITKTNYLGGDNGRMAPVITAGGDAFHCFWNEGSKFVIDSNFLGGRPVAEVFYTDFTDKPVAGLSGAHGNGKIFLSAIHPEINPAASTDRKEAEKVEKKDSKDSTPSSEDTSTKNRKKYQRRMFDYTNITKS